MHRGKPRVQRLLEDTLRSIAREPSITLKAAIIRDEEDIHKSACFSLNSSLDHSGDITVYADKGSLGKFKYFSRLQAYDKKNMKPISIIGFSTKLEGANEIIEKNNYTNERIQTLPIKHEDSCGYKGIQAADLIAGAVFQKEARNEPKW